MVGRRGGEGWMEAHRAVIPYHHQSSHCEIRHRVISFRIAVRLRRVVSATGGARQRLEHGEPQSGVASKGSTRKAKEGVEYAHGGVWSRRERALRRRIDRSAIWDEEGLVGAVEIRWRYPSVGRHRPHTARQPGHVLGSGGSVVTGCGLG